jgi:hypothetical protein
MNVRKAILVMALLGAVVSARGENRPRGVEAIRLHPGNPHYFLFRGKTVALITNGEHYGAVMNLDFDYHKYLATLQTEGLNYTRIFPGSYREVPGKSFGILRNDLAPAEGRFLAPWARSTTAGYAGGGNKFDLNRWDPEYFKRFHDFLREASERGIVVEISLFSSQYGEMQWNLSALNAGNNVNGTSAVDWKKVHTLENGNLLEYQERYTRKVVGEANGLDNVIFEIQNEPFADRPVLDGVVNPYIFPPNREKFPNSIERADELSLAWQMRVAQWITSEEAALPNKHLIAQNYCDFGLPVKELVPGVSVVNFHYAFQQAIAVNYGLDKAIAYDETGFLGQGDVGYRRQAWNFMLSGGSAFDGLDYSFTVGHEDGTDTAPNGPGGGSLTLRRQLGILREFLDKFPLVEMRPDTGTVKVAAGVHARVLSSAGGQYAMYFDDNGPAEVTLRLPAGDYSGEWVNTTTGESTPVEKFAHHGGEQNLRTPAFQNGIALGLKRAAK